MKARFRRPLRRLTPMIAMLLAAVTTLTAVPAAHALPASLLYCEGYFSVTYEPPLTNTPTLTKVTFHNDLGYCPTAPIISGEASGEFSAVRSCTTLDLPPHPATTTIHWNTGASSTIAYSLSTVDRLVNGTTVVTSYGTVTHGFHAGSQAVHTAIQPNLDLTACAGPGVTRLTGPEKLVFI